MSIELEIGRTFKVEHQRKGTFWLQVSGINDEWVTGIIVAGNPNMILKINERVEGDEITVRKSFLTVLDIVPDYASQL